VSQQYLAQTQEQRLQQILAPQLRQSLEVLQVPTLELRSLVQQELQQNPTIEEKPPDMLPLEVEPGSKEAEGSEELKFDEQFQVLSKLDEEWREYFRQTYTAQPYTAEAAAKRQYFFDSLTQPESLQQHLLDQLKLAGLGESDRVLAELIIGSINEDGFVSVPLDELARTTGADPRHLEAVLQVIQGFDPVGVGARDLAECLLLQIRRLGEESSLAAEIVKYHLADLAAKRYGAIARALGVSEEAVQQAARFIATLEPRPGRMFSTEEPAYILPDVVVQKVGDDWTVALNEEHVPHVMISPHYRALLEDPNTPSDVKAYVREKIKAGAFLIKSIHQRQQTIRRIAEEIVRVQRDFFEHGVSGLKPLTMAKVAGVLGVHETTVSRAIANKYMQTPRGVFEMKYFFAPGLKTSSGETISNKTIKELIARMVSEEDPKAPLSDQAIVQRLRDQGIEIARRTVAKYREELHILPSHMRRG
jgi:RNA polymerase sigma-54 factor